MRLKDGSINFAGITADLLQALAVAEDIHVALTGREAVITSLNDGRHMRNSKHYSGEAADLRVWYTDAKECTQEWADTLASALGSDYDVVYGDPRHLDHIHVEYDEKE